MAKDKAGELVKNVGIFAVGTFGSKVLVLLIIPLCTHYIDTKGMGAYDLTYTVVMLLQPIAMLSISDALFRWLLDVSIDHRRVISTWWKLFFIFIAIFSVLYFIIYAFIGFENCITLYLLVVLGCFYQGMQFGTRGLHANKLFAFQGVVYSAVYCFASYLFIVVFQVGYRGLLWSILLATIVAIILMLMSKPELREIHLQDFDRQLAQQMTRYSLFLLPNNVSWWVLNWIGRLVITGFLGLSANGIFSVAMKFPSALSMISSVVLPAWQEQAVTLYESKESRTYFSFVFRSYSRLLMSILLFAIPATQLFVLTCIDQSYFEVTYLVPILYLGACFSAFSGFYGVFYLCDKDTAGCSVTTIIGAGSNLVFALVLVPIFGVVGAAVASTTGNLVLWISRVLQTRKRGGIEINWAQLVSMLLLVCTFSLVTIYFRSSVLSLLIFSIIGLVLLAATNRRAVIWALHRLFH